MNAQQKHRKRKHEEKYGPNAGDQRGLHRNHSRGSAHPKWNGERIVSSHGYAKIRVGNDHPAADPNGYAYEHTVVWLAAGREVPADYVLHHENGDQLDNRIENLSLMLRAEHGRHHIEEDMQRDPKTGRIVGKKTAGRPAQRGSQPDD